MIILISCSKESTVEQNERGHYLVTDTSNVIGCQGCYK